eukprot:1181730-Prorocentrum_minimum.AAC.3
MFCKGDVHTKRVLWFGGPGSFGSSNVGILAEDRLLGCVYAWTGRVYDTVFRTGVHQDGGDMSAVEEENLALRQRSKDTREDNKLVGGGAKRVSSH